MVLSMLSETRGRLWIKQTIAAVPDLVLVVTENMNKFSAPKKKKRTTPIPVKPKRVEQGAFINRGPDIPSAVRFDKMILVTATQNRFQTYLLTEKGWSIFYSNPLRLLRQVMIINSCHILLFSFRSTSQAELFKIFPISRLMIDSKTWVAFSVAKMMSWKNNKHDFLLANCTGPKSSNVQN